ncbi:MAG TPA: nucleotidyltransferase domain-containing protein [Myxococcaceae bacterium]|nr:nucleotidyltransferase domain-containing protein [Myxococcaceae bacterium]
MAIEPQTDVRTCAQTFLARVTRELEEATQRADALRATAGEAAQILRGFGATGVWLFGSLAWGEPHQGSDVDLLVEGVPAASWLDAVRAAERLFAGAQVDALRSEDSPRSLVDRVRAEGARLT